jgi:hypothetical protein
MSEYDEDKEPVRCGVGLWSTGDEDPFLAACEWHDKAYTKDSWAQHNMSRLKTDRTFYAQMLRIAGRDLFARMRAFTYYQMARICGGKFWEGEK